MVTYVYVPLTACYTGVSDCSGGSTTTITPFSLNDCCNSMNGMSYRQDGVCTHCTGMVYKATTYSIINCVVSLVAQDPHFILPLTNGDQLCFNVQGEPDFPFSLIRDKHIQLNGVFVLPAEEESDSISHGASFLGMLGMVFWSPVTGRVNIIKVFAHDRSVVVGDSTLTVVNNKKVNLDITDVAVISIHDVTLPGDTKNVFAWLSINTNLGLSFTVRFYKKHLDLFLTNTSGLTKEADGLIGKYSNIC